MDDSWCNKRVSFVVHVKPPSISVYVMGEYPDMNCKQRKKKSGKRRRATEQGNFFIFIFSDDNNNNYK